jgi:hypothetical protein
MPLYFNYMRLKTKRHVGSPIIIAALLLFSYQPGLSQISSTTKGNKFEYTRFLSVARSSFDVNGFPSSPNYSSWELKLGARITL